MNATWRSAISTEVLAAAMRGCGPGRSPPRANSAATTRGTAEARILKRNMELPAHSGPDAKRAYGWRSVNKAGYRGVDGECISQGSAHLFSHVKQRALVIASASEAIQKAGLLRSSAPRNDADLRPREANRLRVIANSIPLALRGRRECRALDAPAALRAKIKSTQASHHGHTGKHPAVPAQWF